MVTPNDSTPTEYSGYLLRMWRERGSTSSWRFSLENVQGGTRRGFGSLAALVAFLEREVGGQAQPTSPNEAYLRPEGDECDEPSNPR